MMSLRLPMLSVLLVLLSASTVTSFLAPLPSALHSSPLQLRSSVNNPRFAAALRQEPCSLRMSGPTPSLDNSDADAQKEEEEVPVTVLSDDDLDARIAELGLGKEGGVEDKASGETVQVSCATSATAMKNPVLNLCMVRLAYADRAREKGGRQGSVCPVVLRVGSAMFGTEIACAAAKIGSTAIGGVASAAITALNAIEQPIDEEEWQKAQGTLRQRFHKARWRKQCGPDVSLFWICCHASSERGDFCAASMCRYCC